MLNQHTAHQFDKCQFSMSPKHKRTFEKTTKTKSINKQKNKQLYLCQSICLYMSLYPLQAITVLLFLDTPVGLGTQLLRKGQCIFYVVAICMIFWCVGQNLGVGRMALMMMVVLMMMVMLTMINSEDIHMIGKKK